MLKTIGVVVVSSFIGTLAMLLACNKATHLAPLDQQLVEGAMRANVFGATRLDGGAPSANRALDKSSCANLAKVMQHAQVDGGVICPR